MKAIIWKELRENGKWALLAFAGLLLAQLYALSSSGREGGSDNSLTLCSSLFLIVTSFGCAAAGAALGAIQILPELRRDQWAALLHRPVSRDVVFLGKAIAGLLLYFCATLIPFLISVGYVALPGQFAAPLVPGLLLPGLSDIGFGAVFYAAALLICLHRGRWLGNRGAMSLALIPLFVLHVSTGWPFLLPLIATAVLLLAARGAMLTNGSMREMPALGSAACVAVIFLGAYTAIILLVWGLQAFGPKPSYFTATYSNFQITRDGQVFFSTQKGDGSDRTLTDMEGKPVTDERYLGNSGHENFIQTLPFLWSLNLRTPGGIQEFYLRSRPRNLMNYVRTVGRGSESNEVWYLLVEQNIFAGYDKLSRRQVGIFDARGFQAPGVRPEPFPERMQTAFWNFNPPFLYWSGPQLFLFDFSERRMTPLFHAATEPIYGAIHLARDAESTGLVAVALKSGIQFLDVHGKRLGFVPYLEGPALWGEISVGVTEKGDRIFLQYGSNYTPRDKSHNISLQVCDPDGKILHTYSRELPVQNAISCAGWPHQIVPHTLPPALALIGSIHSKLMPPPLPTFDYSSYPRPFFSGDFSRLPGLLSVSLALAGLAAFLAVRAGFPIRSAGRWAIFVACLGLPAFLTFFLAADWPRRLRCPDCQRNRPLDREECPHCRKAWPVPARSGSEILEGA